MRARAGAWVLLRAGGSGGSWGPPREMGPREMRSGAGQLPGWWDGATGEQGGGDGDRVISRRWGCANGMSPECSPGLEGHRAGAGVLPTPKAHVGHGLQVKGRETGGWSRAGVPQRAGWRGMGGCGWREVGWEAGRGMWGVMWDGGLAWGDVGGGHLGQ